MKRFRKNKKGFSLVELIIVIAIMVALVATMAPAFVKYVNKSHDAVVQAAAESVLSFVKAEMGDGSFTGTGQIIVEGRKDSGQEHKTIHVDWKEGNTFKYQPNDSLDDDNGYSQFVSLCGADENKTIKSDLKYVITVYSTQTVDGHPQLDMEELHNG